jgi:hypothetical protein
MYNSPFKNKNIDKINSAGKSTVSNSMMSGPGDPPKKPKTFDYSRLSEADKMSFLKASAEDMMKKSPDSPLGKKFFDTGYELSRRIGKGDTEKGGVLDMSEPLLAKYLKASSKKIKDKYVTEQN